jgi:hypothetical protein
MSKTADNYLMDLGVLILERARESKKRAEKYPKDLFEQGQLTAYYAVLSLIKNQAFAFGLSDKAVGLGGVNLEQEHF